MAEIERLQLNKTGWISGLVILLASLAVFLAVGTGGLGEQTAKESWETLGIVVGVLFVHEMGHYLAMRVFRYRNVRMFFIPGFGAAVSGQGYEAPDGRR